MIKKELQLEAFKIYLPTCCEDFDSSNYLIAFQLDRRNSSFFIVDWTQNAWIYLFLILTQKPLQIFELKMFVLLEKEFLSNLETIILNIKGQYEVSILIKHYCLYFKLSILNIIFLYLFSLNCKSLMSSYSGAQKKRPCAKHMSLGNLLNLFRNFRIFCI